jgi:16S rRNA (uracil1498-N3)-methyltransferase
MECFIVLPEGVDLEHGRLTLRDEEAHHATKSLRLRPGDLLLATDLSGTCYDCRIVTADAHEVTCSISKVLPEYGEPAHDILLIQGMISQPSRWEFLLEKATELGVREIEPIITEFTERTHFKSERSERVLRAAVKQTKRARKPELRLTESGGFFSIDEALSIARQENRSIFMLHESATSSKMLHNVIAEVSESPIAILVGPEGGFSDAEVARTTTEFGAYLVCLGPRRLRAETAALAALAIIMDR